ncbi:pantoate--beta-alanine ligase [Deinococcus sp.]|uniref:pantoate--beta-alanine ligase n=1 Tax=Deinococcus sp. TaxID=47478 RepID=UPI003B5B7389
MSRPVAAQTLPRLLRTPVELTAALSACPDIGLVPTMGALHDGHAHLIRRARAESGVVVLSVFVNPLQFGPGEDYERYPRVLEADLALAGRGGVDIVFAPETAEMYPPGFVTRIQVPQLSDVLDGAARPGHFTGVATVVLKLLNLVRPNRAYFGEKDWQQLSIIRRMVSDLNVTVDIVGVPTVRSELPGEAGLALSSRNQYLTPEQRARASVLHRALVAVQAAYATGERRRDALLSAGRSVLSSEPELVLDYLSLVDSNLVGGDTTDRERVDTEDVNAERFSEARLLVAARLFGVRLIDNLPLNHLANSETP